MDRWWTDIFFSECVDKYKIIFDRKQQFLKLKGSDVK